MRERRRDESTVALLAARRVGSAGLTVPPLLASIVSPRGCSKREMEEACARRDAEEGGVSGISDKGSGGRPKLGATRGNNVEHRRNENPGGGGGTIARLILLLFLLLLHPIRSGKMLKEIAISFVLDLFSLFE